MKRAFVYLSVFCSLLLSVSFSFGQTSAGTKPVLYAQKLVEQVIKNNPDMLDVLLHVTPPGETKNKVIASHLTKSVGELSGDDDLSVMNSAKPIVEVQKDGVRIGVLVQLRDRKGHPIGAMGLMYPYKSGQDQNKVLARSNSIRDNLAKHISNVQELFTAK